MTLTQRLNFLIVLFAALGTSLIDSHPAQATETFNKSVLPSKITPEAAFSDGLVCLKFADIACAQMALVYVQSQSAYAKILSGGIAVLQGNDDLAFRLLLPLASDTTLQPAARASLHASLSLAYEKLPDSQRAIEQKILEEQVLIYDNANPVSIQQTQTKLWALVSSLNRGQLIEMRGASAEDNLQGWIDLALAHQAESSPTAIADWQKAYPDHSAIAFANTLNNNTAAKTLLPVTNQTNQQLAGKVALLLPFNSAGLNAIAMAIQSGFTASASIDKSAIEIKPYAILAQKGDVTQAYNSAINEGANYIIIGEDDSLLAQPLSVPTIMLHGSLDTVVPFHNLYSFSLSLKDDAAKLTQVTHDFGMQNGLVLSDNSNSSITAIKELNKLWQSTNGQTLKQINVSTDFNLLDLKAQIHAQQPDVVLLAGDSEFAKKIRPYLDISIPTFGFSSIYDGVNNDSHNSQLNAIHFIDMPWMLNQASFSDYQAAAKELPQNETQRWFAMGADAYNILKVISQKTIATTTFKGLTGTIHINEKGEVTREPVVGSFTNNGVMLEK